MNEVVSDTRASKGGVISPFVTSKHPLFHRFFALCSSTGVLLQTTGKCLLLRNECSVLINFLRLASAAEIAVAKQAPISSAIFDDVDDDDDDESETASASYSTVVGVARETSASRGRMRVKTITIGMLAVVVACCLALLIAHVLAAVS